MSQSILQEAYTALKEILGEVHREDLLDTLFSNFCLGKRKDNDMNTLIDTHCHITCDALYERIGEVLENAKQEGIEKMLIICHEFY